MKKKITIEIISFLFILLFVYAATNKLMDLPKFRAQIGQSPLLTAYAPLVSIAIPALEILIAIALIIHKLRLFALYAAFSLMVMFTVYIIIILNFSPFVPCSCGGILEKLGWTEHLFFNIGFVFLGVAGILLCSNKTSASDVQIDHKSTLSFPNE